MTRGFLFIPVLSFEGQALADATKYGTSGYNQNGDLETRGNAGQGKLTTSCQEYPYCALMEQLKLRAIKIVRTRMTVQSDEQIDNNINLFKRSAFGKECTDSINGRAYLQPTQYQGKIIDIDQEYIIDRNSGISILVRAGERLNLSFFVKGGLQFNIQIVSTATVDLYAELFAPLDSVLTRKKPQYVNNADVPDVATLQLDGAPLSVDNALAAAGGYETDFETVGVSDATLLAGIHTSRLTLALPLGTGGSFAADYSIVGAVLISAIDEGFYNVTIEFTGTVLISISTLSGGGGGT